VIDVRPLADAELERASAVLPLQKPVDFAPDRSS